MLHSSKHSLRKTIISAKIDHPHQCMVMIRAQCVMSLQNRVRLGYRVAAKDKSQLPPVSNHDGAPLAAWSPRRPSGLTAILLTDLVLELLAHGLRIAQQHLRVGLVEDCQARTSTASALGLMQIRAHPTVL
jgi:hypothetical protein